MKKIVIGLLSAFMFASCEPVIDNRELPGLPTASPAGYAADFGITAIQTEPGGNEITLKNSKPGTVSFWNYIIGTSTKTEETIVLPFTGKRIITFTAICEGGQIEIPLEIDITRLTKPAAPEWMMLTGTTVAGKTWEWASDDPAQDAVYGNGGYQASTKPAWWTVTLDQFKTSEWDEGAGWTMHFDLDGGVNLSKVDPDGKVVEKGTFSFDMSAEASTPGWSVGKLSMDNVSILCSRDNGTPASIRTFDIIELTDDVLTLCYAPAGTGPWGTASFWMLRAKK